MSGSSADLTPVTLDILRQLRRIVRRVEGASDQLESSHGITAPQLLCLHAIVRAGSLTQVEISKEVRLSPSTVVGVIDRLAAKGLVTRRRDRHDRRRIHVSATPAGLDLERTAPEPLQWQVERGLEALADGDRTVIAGSLAKLVQLLEAGHIDAAPVLASGPIPKPADREARPMDGPAPA